MSEDRQSDVRRAVWESQVSGAIERINDEIERLPGQYVALNVYLVEQTALDARLKPIEKLVFGLVGIVLVSVVGAIVALVLR